MTLFTSKDLYRLSREKYRKNGLVSYIIMFFVAALACAFVAINLWVPYLFYFTVPFIILPIFFAGQAAIVIIRDGDTLTLGGFFKMFFVYFSEHFRSTFRTIKSLLFSLIFYGGVLITSTVVVFITFYQLNYLGFATFINQISSLNIVSTEELNALLNKYSYCLDMFFVCTSYPSMSVLSLMFIYFTSKHSVSMFYRLNNYKVTGTYIMTLHSNVMSNYRKQYLRYYGTLNWPFYVLLLGGFALGSYIGYLYHLDQYSLYTFGMMISLFSSYFLFGPNYLANKEAIYEALKDAYEEENKVLSSSIVTSLQDLLTKMGQQKENQNEDNEE